MCSPIKIGIISVTLYITNLLAQRHPHCIMVVDNDAGHRVEGD